MSFIISGEIRARELIENGRSARYANIDRGVLGKDGRGEIGSSCSRDLGNGFREHVTFLYGTINNISTLFNKGIEVARFENDTWVAIDRNEFEKFIFAPCLRLPGELPPVSQPEKVAADVVESGDDNDSGEVVIKTVDDFLKIKGADQLKNLPDAPEAFLAEIIAHPKTTKKVKAAAEEVLAEKQKAASTVEAVTKQEQAE